MKPWQIQLPFPAFAALLVALSLPAQDQAQADVADKIDAGIDNDESEYNVFFRMTDQLFKKGGDYEAFCKEHNGDTRSALRKMVLETLRQKSDGSWKMVEKLIAPFTENETIRNLKRYWIVNGFACQATGQACYKLAADPAVSFVYLKPQGLRPLHKKEGITLRGVKQLKKNMKKALAMQKEGAKAKFNPKKVKVPWNLKRVQADQAWKKEKATGKGVVIGLLDSGLLITPGLMQALWHNEDEELNGKDDDGNGYVDDLFGYDFGYDNWFSIDEMRPRGFSHGSLCGGIMAGRPVGKDKLTTGIAPEAQLMVLRGMGAFSAYEYALANGADILSMSYMWINVELGNYRGLYRLAHEHMTAGGIVSLGGAGNFFTRYPKGKQIALPKDIPCVICVAGIMKDGSKAKPGSEGPCTWTGVKFYDDYPEDKPLQKPDVTALFGGYPCWNRINPRIRNAGILEYEAENNIGIMVGARGNSFSGPHAGGVVALMMSVSPELPAWRYKELLEETAKDIGEKGRDLVFGAGLIQALPAVKAAKAAAKAAAKVKEAAGKRKK